MDRFLYNYLKNNIQIIGNQNFIKYYKEKLKEYTLSFIGYYNGVKIFKYIRL